MRQFFFLSLLSITVFGYLKKSLNIQSLFSLSLVCSAQTKYKKVVYGRNTLFHECSYNKSFKTKKVATYTKQKNYDTNRYSNSKNVKQTVVYLYKYFENKEKQL